MATIDSEQAIIDLMTSDGYFEDDPRVYQIVEYTNFNGRLTWGVTWINEAKNRLHRYEIPSEYVIAPKVIWKAKESLEDINDR